METNRIMSEGEYIRRMADCIRIRDTFGLDAVPRVFDFYS